MLKISVGAQTLFLLKALLIQKVVGLTYAGVLGGPAVIGFIGNAVGLQSALILGIVLAAFVAGGSMAMQKGEQKYGKTI